MRDNQGATRTSSDAAHAQPQDEGTAIPLWTRLVHTYRVELVMAVVLALLLVGMGSASPFALSSSNLSNVLQSAAPLLLVSFGQVLVMITGGIDLSVGSTFALSGITTVVLMQSEPVPVAVAAGFGVGMLVGAINGVLVVYARLVPFIVTLATYSAASSLAYVVSGGNSYSVPGTFAGLDRASLLLGIPNYMLVMLIAAIVIHVFLTRTVFGRFLYAVGSGNEAARLVGVPSNRVKLVAYIASGFLAALAALVTMAQVGAVDPISGGGLQLGSIEAVVIGGASLFGGVGSVPGAVVGTLVVSFLNNALILLRVPSFWQGTVTGVVILIAVVVERVTRGGVAATLRRRLRTARTRHNASKGDAS